MMFRAAAIAAATLATVPKRRYGEYPRQKPPPFPEHQWYVPGARYHHYKCDERTFIGKDGGPSGRIYYFVGRVRYACSVRNWEQWVVGCTRYFMDEAKEAQ